MVGLFAIQGSALQDKGSYSSLHYYIILRFLRVFLANKLPLNKKVKEICVPGDHAKKYKQIENRLTKILISL